jgi:hypothetical protein
MRSSTTLLLLALALLAAIAMYYIQPRQDDELSSQPGGAAANAAQMLVKENLGTADSLTLTLPERELHFTRKAALWQLGSPVHDVVDPDRMATLLATLAEAEILEEVDAKKMSAAAWKLSGLEQPEIHLMVRAGPVALFDYWIGRPGAVQGTTYISQSRQDGTEPRRYLIRGELLSILTQSPETWRDGVLVNAPPGTVSKLVIKSEGTQIEISRDKPKAPWQITKPMRTKAKGPRVDALLKAVASLKITAIEPEAASTGLAAEGAQLQISLHSAQLGEAVQLSLSPADPKEPAKLRATASHRHGTFSVTGESTDLLWAGVNDLRDDRLLEVDTEKVQQVEIRGGIAGDVSLRREGDLWMVHLGSRWQDANTKRVDRMFEELKETSVLEFVTDSATSLESYGLVKPFLTLRWGEQPTEAGTAPTATTPFTTSPLIGLSSELQIGLAEGGKVYARFEDKPFVYRVPAAVLDAFPRDNVRWKSLSPLRFSPFSLRSISLAMGAQPPVQLEYDPNSANWRCNRAGQDLTAMVERSKADALASKLGSLLVNDWLQNRSDGAKALQSPAISVSIGLLQEAGNLSSPVQQHQLLFAPTQDMSSSAFFYGRLDSSPDVFLIGRAELLELVGKSIFKDASKAPQSP